MLSDLLAAVNSGAIQQLGHLVYDVLVTSVHSIASVLDLPVDMSSLESSLRFVKISGFEDSTTPMVLAPMVGLAIGRGRMGMMTGSGKGSTSNSATSSASASGIYSTEAPAASPKPVLVDESLNSGFGSVVPRAMFLFLMLDVLGLIM